MYLPASLNIFCTVDSITSLSNWALSSNKMAPTKFISRPYVNSSQQPDNLTMFDYESFNSNPNHSYGKMNWYIPNESDNDSFSSDYSLSNTAFHYIHNGTWFLSIVLEHFPFFLPGHVGVLFSSWGTTSSHSRSELQICGWKN